MPIISIIYAFIASTLYLLFYIYTYKKYFALRPNYYIGVAFVLLSVYLQFYIAASVDLSIGYTALLSFITYPIGLYLIFKTNIFNILFLSFNIIVKIYIMFLFFSTLYAIKEGISYDPMWIKSTSYYAFSQGHAYLISIASLYLADVLLLRNKLSSFFQLKRNLLFLIFIQLIILVNVAWISFTHVTIDTYWYNNLLIITSLSFEVIYFLLRLFTTNSSYFSSYKMHSELLSKQLNNQIEHYKHYDQQMRTFMKFKHDYQKVYSSVINLIELKNYDAIEKILKDYDFELHQVDLDKNYSNNLILDALLNDYANRFNKIDTTLIAKAYIQIGQMTELDLIKLFYNVLENIYEALIDVEPSVRKVEIQSEVLDNYLKLSFINTTIHTSISNDKTTKSDKDNHGFGSTIIKDVLDKYYGFKNDYINNVEDIAFYHLDIYLPINQ